MWQLLIEANSFKKLNLKTPLNYKENHWKLKRHNYMKKHDNQKRIPCKLNIIHTLLKITMKLAIKTTNVTLVARNFRKKPNKYQ